MAYPTLPRQKQVLPRTGVAIRWAVLGGLFAIVLLSGCRKSTYPVLYEFVLNPSFTGNTSATRKALGVESVSMYSYDSAKAGRALWEEDLYDSEGRLKKRVYYNDMGQPEQTTDIEYFQDDLPLRVRVSGVNDTTTQEFYYSVSRHPQKSVMKYGTGQQVEYVYSLSSGGKQLRADVFTVNNAETDSSVAEPAFSDIYILNKKQQPEMRVQLSPQNDTLGKSFLTYSPEGRLLNTVSFQQHRIESAHFIYDSRGLLITKHYTRNGKYNGSDAFEYKFRK